MPEPGATRAALGTTPAELAPTLKGDDNQPFVDQSRMSVRQSVGVPFLNGTFNACIPHGIRPHPVHHDFVNVHGYAIRILPCALAYPVMQSSGAFDASGKNVQEPVEVPGRAATDTTVRGLQKIVDEQARLIKLLSMCNGNAAGGDWMDADQEVASSGVSRVVAARGSPRKLKPDGACHKHKASSERLTRCPPASGACRSRCNAS